jgi:MoxR-like ATPase
MDEAHVAALAALGAAAFLAVDDLVHQDSVREIEHEPARHLAFFRPGEVLASVIPC